MTDSGASQFHTGQPVWVIEPDGSRRPCEYLGQGERPGGLQGSPEALVIYVDRPGHDVVAIERLRPREGMNRGARRAKQAGDAAARRAEQARQRGQAAERRATQLRDARVDPQNRAHEAPERALSATDAAKEAQFNAAQA